MITFIFGAPRSGTTWLWKMISLHPKVESFNRKGSSESGIYHTSDDPKRDILKFMEEHPEKHIVEKTPLHVFHYEEIKKDFPESKNIVIYRNPYAIINSMLKSDMEAFKGYTLDTAIVEVKKYLEKLSFIASESYYVEYERLLENPSFELNNIFEWLGLPHSEIESIVEQTYKRKLVTVKGHLRSCEANGWKKELSKEQKSYIKSCL